MRFRVDLSCDALFMSSPNAECPADVLPIALAAVREWARMTGLSILVEDIQAVSEGDLDQPVLQMENQAELRRVG